ncbi:MAG: hypothetical protein AAFV45_00505 [Pseudomonadota bacterium]
MTGGAVGLFYTPWLLTSLPDADGNLEPLSMRIMLATLVGVVSLLCTVGLWCYQSIYVARLARDNDTVIVHTQGLLQQSARAIPVTAFRSSRAYGGRLFIPGQVSVNTPFHTIKVEGWWLPLLVDDQSRHIDLAALASILRDSENIRGRKAKGAVGSKRTN